MNKFAYVTGADRGLGLALVAELLERGYTVFAGSYLTDAEGLVALQGRYGDALTVLPLDIGKIESVNAAAAAIRSKTDAIHVLINNAGIGPMHDKVTTIEGDLDYDEILTTIDINAVGMLRVTKSVLELLMKPEDKRLINITSLAASVGLLTRQNQYGYTMSKAASNMQTKLIYNTLHEKGLQVFALHPGWMHTSIFGDNPDLMKGAPFEPEDSAKLILDSFLTAKNESDHIFFNNDGTPMEY